MISYISGTITHIDNNKLVVCHGPIGFELLCPTARYLLLNSTVELHTHLHWSQENGPSLYGFERTLQKDLFVLLIDCSGIGPKLAISILEQAEPAALIEMIMQANMSALGKIKGLGAKKAEILCLHLKNNASKLLEQHPTLTATTSLGVWNDLHETLTSLNYSLPEIKQTTSILKESLTDHSVPFDLLLRKALTILARK